MQKNALLSEKQKITLAKRSRTLSATPIDISLFSIIFEFYTIVLVYFRTQKALFDAAMKRERVLLQARIAADLHRMSTGGRQSAADLVNFCFSQAKVDFFLVLMIDTAAVKWNCGRFLVFVCSLSLVERRLHNSTKALTTLFGLHSRM